MSVKIKCYGEVKEFETRQEAINFFTECLRISEGAEFDRYMHILCELLFTKSSEISDEVEL
jgi:hypothetical protein